MRCSRCFCVRIDKGRAPDGRRAYRCQQCRYIWTRGLQGKKPQFSLQRPGYQFNTTGAYAWGNDPEGIFEKC